MKENLKPKIFRLPIPLIKRIGHATTDLDISEQELAKRAFTTYLNAVEEENKKTKK